jgi:hypothetical protein
VEILRQISGDALNSGRFDQRSMQVSSKLNEKGRRKFPIIRQPVKAVVIR